MHIKINELFRVSNVQRGLNRIISLATILKDEIKNRQWPMISGVLQKQLGSISELLRGRATNKSLNHWYNNCYSAYRCKQFYRKLKLGKTKKLQIYKCDLYFQSGMKMDILCIY